VAQGGAWDVDGTGIQTIEDESVATALRAKVNSFNLKVSAQGFAVSLAIAALPIFWQ